MGQVLHGSATTTEAVVVAFRRHTLLPLDDCLYALQATIPHLASDLIPDMQGAGAEVFG